ncbi:transmembrane protein 231-like isoform X2 [Neoarius graeffei]|uniref:transmembrane protein 231-like isoform X2 n=1 Tax=Neoarius graeffei TaxID=443677 RepID=UPI00298D2FB8|nr:transmembrane protein 231-like isoform X2 [Neoarius graeffei]
MGFYEVYSHPVLIRYKARVCSRASVFVLVVYLLTYIPPLLITYRSQGFWLKQSSYEEQPVVQFQYEMLMMGVTSVSGEYVAWSTFSNFNTLLEDKLRIPTVSRMSVVVMQSMVLVQASSPVPVSQLFISGDLKLQQKEPLSHRGVHTHYNSSQSYTPVFQVHPSIICLIYPSRMWVKMDSILVDFR